MKTPDVVFLYEHVARELDVACAITALLRKHHGLHVEIVQWSSGFPQAVTHIRQPKLVILPFCYTEQSFESLLAYWRKARFFNLTWEQLFYIGNQKAKTPRGEFALKHVVHHAWSEPYASFLKENGLEENRIFLNGQPAYALYDDPYRRYFLSRQEMAQRYQLDPSRRWIFFPENYNWAFYSEATIKYFIQSGQSPEDVRAMREYCDLSLHDIVRWLANVACDDRFEVILRPRPSVTKEEFIAAIKKSEPELPPHLHVIQQGSVREWILASDMVFSSHSTSLIEAAVAGKPVYMVEPYPIPAALKVGWQELLPHLQTQTQFVERCARVERVEDDRLAQWARNTLLGRGDPIARLASFIKSLLEENTDHTPPPSRDVATPSLGWIPPAALWSLYRRLKQRIRYPATDGIEPGFVKDIVDPDVIEANIQKWSHLLA